MADRRPEQARTTRAAVVAALTVGVLVLGAAQALSIAYDEPMVTFTRDLQRTAGVPWYAGAVSVFTNQMWIAAGTVSLLVAWLLPPERRRLAALGLFVLVLGVDDSLLLHEGADENGIPQGIFFVAYACATVLLTVMMLRGPSRGMAMAFTLGAVFLACSVFLDQVVPGQHLLEDGAKLLGALVWLTVPVIAYGPGQRSAMAPTSDPPATVPAPTSLHRRTLVGVSAAATLVVVAIGAAVWSTRPDATATGDHPVVVATAETESMPHDGDSADDAAIWVHPDDTARSTIIGTDKRGGIAVYDLDGDELQYLPDGNLNNVDLRHDFSLGAEPTTIVAASDRSDNTLAIYRIDPQTGTLRDVAARAIDVGIDIYGLCMYRDVAGTTYVFVNSTEGDLQQWRLADDGAGTVDAELVRSFDAGGQLEGCVADDELGQLYLGEEDVGIRTYDAAPDGDDDGTLIAEASDEGPLVADVEGLTIGHGHDEDGYLVASSQGNSTFVVYRRTSPHEHLFTFSIGDGQATDGASETDGIDVTTADLGPAFPSGLFVVHDGDNDDENQNFKLVPWGPVAALLEATSAGSG